MEVKMMQGYKTFGTPKVAILSCLIPIFQKLS